MRYGSLKQEHAALQAQANSLSAQLEDIVAKRTGAAQHIAALLLLLLLLIADRLAVAHAYPPPIL